VKPEQLAHYEALLLKERERIMSELGASGVNHNQTPRESSGDLSAYSFHMADQASDSADRETSFFLASIETQMLDLIDAALTRLRRGEYGRCASCEREIPPERLEAVPHAVHCLECQERQERETRGGAAEA